MIIVMCAAALNNHARLAASGFAHEPHMKRMHVLLMRVPEIRMPKFQDSKRKKTSLPDQAVFIKTVINPPFENDVLDVIQHDRYLLMKTG